MSKEAKAKAKDKKESFPKRFVNRVKKYFKDTKGELKRIVWPEKNKVVHDTLVVIGMVIVAGIVVWGFDTILGLIVNLLLKNA